MKFKDPMTPWKLMAGPLAMALVGLANLTGTTTALSAEPKQQITLASEVTWTPLNRARGAQSPMAGNLWGDRAGAGATGFLVSFVDGFTSPPHIHNVTYRGVVISGLIHNDDPGAAKMWMPPGSYWTQPAGEAHITSAKGATNVAYIEIERGPYLVHPVDQASDNGERPINIHQSNLVWQDSSSATWIAKSATDVKIAFLWGKPENDQLNGTLVKLPRGSSGKLRGQGASLRAVVIKGRLNYKLPAESKTRSLQPGAYFGSDGQSEHSISCEADSDCLVYVRSEGEFKIMGTGPSQ